MGLVLLHDYVLVAVDPVVPYHQSEGLKYITVPEMYSHGSKDRAVFGTVLKCGPECVQQAVKEQAHVAIEKWRGAYINPAQSLMVVREPDILMVMD